MRPRRSQLPAAPREATAAVPPAAEQGARAGSSRWEEVDRSLLPPDGDYASGLRRGAGDEVAHGLREALGLLEVGEVTGVRNDDEAGVADGPRALPRRPWAPEEVLLP